MTSTHSCLCAVALVFLASSVRSQVANPLSNEQVFDRWGPLVQLTSADEGFQGWEPLPVHAMLLPTDPPEVLFIGARRKPGTLGELSEEAHERYCWSLVLDPAFGKNARAIGSRFEAAAGSAATPASAIVYTHSIEQPFETESAVGMTLQIDDLFCGGHTLLDDGRVVVAGGTRIRYPLDDTSFPAQIFGLESTALLDPSSGEWTLTRPMVGAGDSFAKRDGSGGRIGSFRWYPTLTRLPDGSILALGGYDVLFGLGAANQYQPNSSIELFDPVSETWNEKVPTASSRRELLNRTYPHAFVLPEPVRRAGALWDVLVLGEAGAPVFLSTETWTLDVSDNLRPGATQSETFSAGWGSFDTNFEGVNLQASSVLLPLRLESSPADYTNGSVLVVGSDWRHLVEAEHIDVYDPSTDTWLDPMALGVNEDNDGLGIPEAHARSNPATVLLPNGQVLIVGGNDPNDDPSLGSGGSDDCTRYAYYVDPSVLDPATGRFRIRRGSSPMDEQRSYHSIALLLPDARVLVGGGQDRSGLLYTEKNTLRVLEPEYLFDASGARAERPQILWSPSSMTYGSTFTLTSSVPEQYAEYVLLAPGSMTHAFDFNQRCVQLQRVTALQVAGTTPDPAPTTTLLAPPNASVAPPGDYMLFLTDRRSGTPSVAKLVRVEHSAPTPRTQWGTRRSTPGGSDASRRSR